MRFVNGDGDGVFDWRVFVFFSLEFLLEIWSSECGWLICYNVGT